MLIVLCFRCEALRLIALTGFEFQHVLHEIVHGTAAVSHDLDDLLYLGISLRTDGHRHGILLVDAIALQKHATVIDHLILLHCLEILDVNTVVKSNCLSVSCTAR